MLHNIWKTLRENRFMESKPWMIVPVSLDLALDLRWWKDVVCATEKGCSYHKPKWAGGSLSGSAPCSDASMTGMGGHWRGFAWQHKWTKKEKQIIAASKDIQVGEIAAVLGMAFVCQDYWENSRVVFGCDNLGVVQAVNCGDAREDRTHVLIRYLTNMAI
jgi:hypothetical protein